MIDILIKNVIPCSINIIVIIYIISKLLNKSFNFNNPKNYIFVVLLIVVNVANFLYFDDLVRIVVSTIFISIANYLIFNETLNRTVVSTITEQLLMFISEIIYAVCLINLLDVNGNSLISEYYGTLISVLFISAIAIILINVKIIKKFLLKIVNGSNKLKSSYLTASALLLILIMNILLVTVYHDVNIETIILVNFVFIIMCACILYKNLVDGSNIVKMQVENKALLNNLEEYEKMLDYQRVANHENKNQLLVVRSLLKENENSDALNYVNEVLDDKKDDNDVLFGRAKKIPSGGLQGIVYQKMLVMNDKNIKPILDVSNSVKKFKFENLDTKLNYDICRIIGVFLDNAIEETEKLDEREIMLSMHEQNNDLVIEISNKFKNVPDLERLEEKGYSTKGKGHGYGLSLVNDIVNNNNQIINEKGITRNIFTQKLIIKMQFKN